METLEEGTVKFNTLSRQVKAAESFAVILENPANTFVRLNAINGLQNALVDCRSTISDLRALALSDPDVAFAAG
jgi:hypothetical protein